MIQLSDLPTLHKLVRAGPTELEFRKPQRDFVQRGVVVWLLTALLAGPCVSAVLLMLMALGMPEPEGDAVLVPLGALGVLVSLGFGWGLVLIATQRHRAEKTRVSFDASTRLVRFPRSSIAWHEVEAVVAAVRGQGSRSQRLELALRNSGERLEVVRTRSSIMPQELAVLTERLAQTIGAVPHITWQTQNLPASSRYTLGLKPNEKLYVLATLFIPFGALFTALTQRRGSLVRFVALQELIRAAATFALVFGTAGCLALLELGPATGSSSPLLRHPGLAVLLCLLSVLVVASQLSAIVAVVRAFDGEAWIIPGLGPLVRRFTPRPRTAPEMGAVPAVATGGGARFEPNPTPWPRTMISQMAATSLTLFGVSFFALSACGIGTCRWFSLPDHAVPASDLREPHRNEIARLVELGPGERLSYVDAWSIFDPAEGLSVLTDRRVLVYDPRTSPKLQSIELLGIERVRLQASSGWSEPNYLIVSGAGRTLEVPLWDTEEHGDKKFVAALEKARTSLNRP